MDPTTRKLAGTLPDTISWLYGQLRKPGGHTPDDIDALWSDTMRLVSAHNMRGESSPELYRLAGHIASYCGNREAAATYRALTENLHRARLRARRRYEPAA